MVRTKEDRSEIKSIQQEEIAREGFSLSLAIIVQSIYFAFLLSLQNFFGESWHAVRIYCQRIQWNNEKRQLRSSGGSRTYSQWSLLKKITVR